MKRISTLLFSLIFLLASQGYAYQNRLTISSNNKNALRVQIDGKFYQVNKKDAELMINDQRPGYRNIKVYLQKNNGRGGRGINERDMQLLYNGNLYIKEGYHTDITINRFGKAFIDERVMGRNDDDDYNDNNWNNNRQPMNERSFNQLKQTVSRESFDDTRMSIAKTAVANNYLSSYQVKELVNLFSFENSKLDLAKYCYRFATDPGNYYVVTEAFTYSNSKTELMQYIQQNR